MIVIYLLSLLILSLASWLTRLRSGMIEGRYIAATEQADTLAREFVLRGGTNKQPDVYLAAKRQYALGRLIDKRDRLEAKYDTWQARYDYCRYLKNRLLQWRGRLLPYFLGIFDVGMAVTTLMVVGIDPAHVDYAISVARACVNR